MAATSGDQRWRPGKCRQIALLLRHDSVIVNGNRIDSRDLFAVEREIIISHGEDTYRLRLTAQNKLILTK